MGAAWYQSSHVGVNLGCHEPSGGPKATSPRTGGEPLRMIHVTFRSRTSPRTWG